MAGGLRTGDLVRAVVRAPSVKAGTYVGRLAVRATGSCNITTARQGVVQSIHVRHCRPLHRVDGYRYSTDPTAGTPSTGSGGGTVNVKNSTGGGASSPRRKAGASAPEIR